MKQNSQYFGPIDREQGLDIEFIKCLISLRQESIYNDIHIYEEEGGIVIEWAQVPFDHSYGGTFQFVDEEEQVMKELVYPDNSSEWVPLNEEENFMELWQRENPDWVKNEYKFWEHNESDGE